MLEPGCVPEDLVYGLFSLAASPAIELPHLLEAVLEAAIRVTASDVGGAIFIPSPAAGRVFWSFRSVEGTPKRSPKKLAGEWEGGQRSLPAELTKGFYKCEDPSADSSLSFFRESRSVACMPLLQTEPRWGRLQVEATGDRAYCGERLQSLTELTRYTDLLARRLLMREHAAQRGLDIHFVGLSRELLKLEGELELVAADPKSPVLIRGERGSGKELAAYAIHYHSHRRKGPFVPANSAAFAPTLAADELFGHARGAFTGAHQGRQGLFQAAQGGTLFLDEIGDLPLDIQASLLRVLDQGQIRQLGSDRPMRADVRMIAATNKDLEAMVAAGTFRGDLYDRLNVLGVRVPPLRARKSDIPLLVDFFLRRACMANGRSRRMGSKRGCSACLQVGGRACTHPALYEELSRQDFPGNVRELRNLIFGLAAKVVEDELGPVHLPHGATAGERERGPGTEDLRLDCVVAQHIGRVLAKTGGNKTQAAKLLGLPLTTLVNKMKKLGVD